ncbi:Zinc finger CCHC-type [Trinorchestia longiramus]|nr:Zinc finger CCHC-type [Trinorchestia longiramus]
MKEFKKQGVARPWIDIKYEENDRMTFYDGFYVKKEAVEDLDKLKRSLELEGLGGEKVKIKMMKPLRKANRVLFKELLYEQKFKQIKEGTYTAPAKVWSKKDGKNKKTNEGKENGDLEGTKAAKSNVKQKNKNDNQSLSKNPATVSSIEGLDFNFEISENEASDDDDEKENSKLIYKGTSYSFVDTDLSKLENSGDSDEDEGIKIKKSKHLKSSNKTKKLSENNNKDVEVGSSDEGIELTCMSGNETMEVEECTSNDSDLCEENMEPQIKFEENSLMTCVEGIWVRRSKLGAVASLRKAIKKEVITGRPDGDESAPLTEEETAKYKSALKVELNKLSNQLQAYLKKVTKKHAMNSKGKKNSESKRKSRLHRSERKALKSGVGKKFQDESRQQNFRGVDKKVLSSSVRTKNGLVNFRGYWIKPEGAKRLHQLENRLKAEGTAKERIAELIKVERRREENELKRERRQVCFSCRKTGHMVADCPLKRNTEGIGACFKCGSLEHQSDSCSQEQFNYATCFICRQKGHISRECPRNSKGLYPHGGGCTLCDSNQHLIKDCPRNMEEKKEREELRVSELKTGELLEAVEDDAATAPVTSVKKKKKNKVVQF